MYKKIYETFGLTNYFDRLLYRTQAFISGGTALSLFLGEDIRPEQDLDIFLRIPYKKENDYGYNSENNVYYPFEKLALDYFKKDLEQSGYKRNWTDTFEKSMKEEETKELEYHKSAISKYVKSIHNFSKVVNNVNRKIQIIVLYDCSISEFFTTFDLNICKIAITFNYGLQFYHENDQYDPYLSKDELQLIRDKKMYIANVFYPANVATRIKKYIQRGFTLVDKISKELIFEENPTDEDIDNYVKENIEQKIITCKDLFDKEQREYLESYLRQFSNINNMSKKISEQSI